MIPVSSHFPKAMRALPALAIALLLPALAGAQRTPANAPKQADPLAAVPNLATIIGTSSSELAPVIERYSADQASLARRYDATDSPDQRRRMREFYTGWRTRLAQLDFDKLKQEGRVDYVLLDNFLQHQIALLDRQDKFRAEMAPLLPFGDRLLGLQDTSTTPHLTIDVQAESARTLSQITHQVDSIRALFEVPAGRGGGNNASSDSSGPRARDCTTRHTHGGQPHGRNARSDAERCGRLVPLLRWLRPPLLLVGQGAIPTFG